MFASPSLREVTRIHPPKRANDEDTKSSYEMNGETVIFARNMPLFLPNNNFTSFAFHAIITYAAY